MDNSTYVPNHLPPPSLVVFSQSGGLPEALRMQRPFNPQVSVPLSFYPYGLSLRTSLHFYAVTMHPACMQRAETRFNPLTREYRSRRSRAVKFRRLREQGHVVTCELPERVIPFSIDYSLHQFLYENSIPVSILYKSTRRPCNYFIANMIIPSPWSN